MPINILLAEVLCTKALADMVMPSDKECIFFPNIWEMYLMLRIFQASFRNTGFLPKSFLFILREADTESLRTGIF